MLRPFMTLALVVAVCPRLAAQEKPTPAVQQAIAATWLFDQSKSDTVAGDPTSGGAQVRGALGGGGARGGGGGGGGGGGRGGGRTAPPTTPPPDAGAPPEGGGNQRGRVDPRLELVFAEADPGAGININANDSLVAMATATMIAKSLGATEYKTDGKKRQEALMDGTIIETQASWSDGVLTIVKSVAGVGLLKREFKLSKDGKVLEIKEHIEAAGRKADKKLVFNRKQ